MGFLSKIFGTKETADNTPRTTPDKAPAKPWEGDFVSALSVHLQGDLETALAAYGKLAAELPDEPFAPFFAAAIKAGQGNTAEAAQTLRNLSRQASLTEESLSRVIVLELAAQLAQKPLFFIPAVAELIVTFGGLLKADGFVQEAAVCYEMAAGLVPDNANVLHKLGDTLHDLRVYDYAESVLLEALGCAPNHWGALYTLAVLLQDLGRDEEAIIYYEKASRLNPDHVNCQNNYGAALLRTNRLDEALTHCSLAAKYDPSSPFARINLGNIYLLMENYESARASFTEAISLNGNLALAYYGLGSVEQALGSDPVQVQELYLKAIEISPTIPEPHQALGKLLAAAGNSEALAQFSTAAQLNNNLKNLHKDFGIACLNLGRREEALDHLKTALQQNPDDVMVQEMLGRMAAGNPL